jgi:hypothetical protein
VGVENAARATVRKKRFGTADPHTQRAYSAGIARLRAFVEVPLTTATLGDVPLAVKLGSAQPR